MVKPCKTCLRKNPYRTNIVQTHFVGTLNSGFTIVWSIIHPVLWIASLSTRLFSLHSVVASPGTLRTRQDHPYLIEVELHSNQIWVNIKKIYQIWGCQIRDVSIWWSQTNRKQATSSCRGPDESGVELSNNYHQAVGFQIVPCFLPSCTFSKLGNQIIFTIYDTWGTCHHLWQAVQPSTLNVNTV